MSRGAAIFGWLMVVLLLCGSVVSCVRSGSQHAEIALTAEQESELAKLAPERYSTWLTTFARTLDTSRVGTQILILQAIPNEAPQVIATAQDTSDEVGATHWRSPWPAVNEALAVGRLEEPATIDGQHGKLNYRHHLIPFDETRSKILLVNTAAGQRDFFGLHSLCWMLAVAVALGLINARTRE